MLLLSPLITLLQAVIAGSFPGEVASKDGYKIAGDMGRSVRGNGTHNHSPSDEEKQSINNSLWLEAECTLMEEVCGI